MDACTHSSSIGYSSAIRVILGKFELENFGHSKAMWFLKLMTYFTSKSLWIEWWIALLSIAEKFLVWLINMLKSDN